MYAATHYNSLRAFTPVIRHSAIGHLATPPAKIAVAVIRKNIFLNFLINPFLIFLERDFYFLINQQ